MATVKITVTLPEEEVDKIRELVAAKQADSVSGFVAHAIHIALNDAEIWDQTLKKALDETGGPLTDKERAWVDSLLVPPTRQKKTIKKRKAA